MFLGLFTVNDTLLVNRGFTPYRPHSTNLGITVRVRSAYFDNTIDASTFKSSWRVLCDKKNEKKSSTESAGLGSVQYRGEDNLDRYSEDLCIY